MVLANALSPEDNFDRPGTGRLKRQVGNPPPRKGSGTGRRAVRGSVDGLNTILLSSAPGSAGGRGWLLRPNVRNPSLQSRFPVMARAANGVGEADNEPS
jgi:hypothetical protein